MKKEIQKMLKEKGRIDLFNEERYNLIKLLMKQCMKKDAWLNNYLSLDPFNKAQWCSDQLIKLVDEKLI